LRHILQYKTLYSTHTIFLIDNVEYVIYGLYSSICQILFVFNSFLDNSEKVLEDIKSRNVPFIVF
jgi:hypothetical protein